MNSNKPYLLRALHEWLTDNDDIPHLLVDGSIPELSLLKDFVQEGTITLNVSYGATQSLQLTNDFVSFTARFSGKSVPVSFPVSAVLGVFGRNSGQGMMFPEESELPPEPSKESSKPVVKKSHLSVVK